MKPLNSYDKKGILAEEVFVEIFEQEDAIRRAQMLLSFQDRAKELGVKGQFDTMVKAFEKAEKETQQKQRQSQTLIENWTNFTGKYDSMKCGSWLAADNGIRTFNKDYSNEVIVCTIQSCRSEGCGTWRQGKNRSGWRINVITAGQRLPSQKILYLRQARLSRCPSSV